VRTSSDSTSNSTLPAKRGRRPAGTRRARHRQGLSG
jgi:hypothetical protein